MVANSPPYHDRFEARINEQKHHQLLSETTPLTAGQAYTSPEMDVAGLSKLDLTIFADKAGAAGSFIVEFSGDGTNWDAQKVLTDYAINTKPFITPIDVVGRKARVKFTNADGVNPMTIFRLHVHGRAV